jgi:hypothetical protein
MVQPLAPCVGENRPVEVVKCEAEDLFTCSQDFEQRLEEVMAEIEESEVETIV